ncbi:unnamed protein product [Chondrus crispus]|uniref:Tc3 transposase DNA binding domain-containing protein n=1 Tax=Chondrus crispus TaxID=2769 RepID=R7QUI3_CHOCR|nr:unnamed protein product [Chondrus crispus]CDF41141.1 unnamed protein product [Chondrus crispus]|eukprot:XP_005711435.1 unnamed protein product [Chondrus crispus]
MPRGKLLSDLEKGEIVAMKRECMSIPEIARTLSRSPRAVQNFCKHPKRVDAQKGARNASKKRLLLRDASKGEKSCKELKLCLDIGIGVRRIQQILRATPHQKYKKMLKRPQMLERHKVSRLEWSKKYCREGVRIGARLFSQMRKNST